MANNPWQLLDRGYECYFVARVNRFGKILKPWYRFEYEDKRKAEAFLKKQLRKQAYHHRKRASDVSQTPRKYIHLFSSNVSTEYSSEKRPTLFRKKGEGRFVSKRTFNPDRKIPGTTEVKVRCCGSHHRISVDENWNLTFHAHETVDELKAAISLGYSGTHRCLEVKQVWDELVESGRFARSNTEVGFADHLLNRIPEKLQQVARFAFGVDYFDTHTLRGLRYSYKEKHAPKKVTKKRRLSLKKEEAYERLERTLGYSWAHRNEGFPRPKTWGKNVWARGLHKAVDSNWDPVFVLHAVPYVEDDVPVLVLKKTGERSDGKPAVQHVWAVAKKWKGIWLVEEK